MQRYAYASQDDKFCEYSLNLNNTQTIILFDKISEELDHDVSIHISP